MKIFKIVILLLSISAFSQEVKTNSENKSDDTIYSSTGLESQPEYEGGIKEFYAYLSKNFTITPEALKNKINGKIFTEFVIEKDGSLTDIKVIRSLGYGLDEEAIRILKNCKRWTSGVQNGKKVRVRYLLPINVSIK